ncbi:MAG: hypothetical protein ACI96N_003260 [Arenicella sp.]|jgi:hypothetical protein
MFKKIAKLLGAIALTGWMGVANATLIFDFSWDSSNGKVTGEILGLVDNDLSQVASIINYTRCRGTIISPGMELL